MCAQARQATCGIAAIATILIIISLSSPTKNKYTEVIASEPPIHVPSSQPVLIESPPIRIQSSASKILGVTSHLDVSCSVPCQLVRENDESVDAVVVYIPDLPGPRLPPRAYPGQLFFGLSFECPAYYPLLMDYRFMSQFNYTIGYANNTDNHVWVPFGPFPFLAENTDGYPREYNFSEAFRDYDENRPRKISWFGGNCGDKIGRYKLVDEILQQPGGFVHSYGGCHHNTNLDVDFAKYHSHDSVKVKALRNHTFDLAFENADCIDWVTEKIFQSMAAGAIPVYLGTSSIDQYIPHPDAIIKVSDFDTVQALVEYINKVNDSPVLKKKHLRWKHDPGSWSLSFKQLYDVSRLHTQKSLGCIVCETVHKIRLEGTVRHAHIFPLCKNPR